MKLLRILALGLLMTEAAHAAVDDPSRPTTQSVKQLLDALGSKNMIATLEGQLDTMMKRVAEQSLDGRPLSPAQQSIVDDMRSRVLAMVEDNLKWPSIEPMLIDIYKTNFTQKEVDGMLVFYRSDVGKAVVAKLPQAMISSTQMMQSKMASMLPQIQELQRNTIRKLEASEVLETPAAPPEKNQ